MPTASRILDDLPFIDVFSAEYKADPERFLVPIREDGGLARSPRGLEVLSYEANQDVYKDPILVVPHHMALDACGLGPGDGWYDFIVNLNINNAEGTLHRRLRGAVSALFSPKQVEAYRTLAGSMLSGWLEELKDAGSCSFMRDVAERLPSSVFLLMCGAPVDGYRKFADLSNSLIKMMQRDPRYRDEILGAYDELVEASEGLLDAARDRIGRGEEPERNVIDQLVAAERRGALRPEETVGMVVTFLFAAADTTSGQLGLMLMSLHENKDQWHALRKDPEKIPGAVLELARFNPGLTATGRLVTKTTEFRDVKIEAGSTVWSNVRAANWDPEVYDEPTRLDVARELSSPPLNWGMGHHACLGRVLAVMELQEGLRALTTHWEDFEIVGEPEVFGFPFNTGPVRLDVRFTPA